MLLFAVSCSRRISLGSLCSFAWKWLGVSKQGGFLYGLYLNKHRPEPNRWKITIVSQREAINTSYCSHNGWNAPQWGKAQICTSGQSWAKLVSAALNGGKKISKVKQENSFKAKLTLLSDSGGCRTGENASYYPAPSSFVTDCIDNLV